MKKTSKRKALWTTMKHAHRPRTMKAKPKRKGLRQRSRAMTLKMRAYLKQQEEFFQNHPYCDACRLLSLPGRNWPHSPTEIHHVRGRSGKLLLDERYWVGACAVAHRFIHDHPDKARAAGLLPEKGGWNRQP